MEFAEGLDSWRGLFGLITSSKSSSEHAAGGAAGSVRVLQEPQDRAGREGLSGPRREPRGRRRRGAPGVTRQSGVCGSEVLFGEAAKSGAPAAKQVPEPRDQSRGSARKRPIPASREDENSPFVPMTITLKRRTLWIILRPPYRRTHISTRPRSTSLLTPSEEGRAPAERIWSIFQTSFGTVMDPIPQPRKHLLPMVFSWSPFQARPRRAYCRTERRCSEFLALPGTISFLISVHSNS